MSDLKKYVAKRKTRDKKFAEGYGEGYEQFKVGVVLRQARKVTEATINVKPHKGERWF